MSKDEKHLNRHLKHFYQVRLLIFSELFTTILDISRACAWGVENPIKKEVNSKFVARKALTLIIFLLGTDIYAIYLYLSCFIPLNPENLLGIVNLELRSSAITLRSFTIY